MFSYFDILFYHCLYSHSSFHQFIYFFTLDKHMIIVFLEKQVSFENNIFFFLIFELKERKGKDRLPCHISSIISGPLLLV